MQINAHLFEIYPENFAYQLLTVLTIQPDFYSLRN